MVLVVAGRVGWMGEGKVYIRLVTLALKDT